tara:strand:+ start:285 stop:1247 length:963 start_codon:yes stop_codon:yes gene_type:complete
MGSATDLTSLADLAAERLAQIFGARPLLVQLWQDNQTVSAARGGEMSADMHVMPVHTGSRVAGEVVLDRKSEPGPDIESVLTELSAALTALDAQQAIVRDRDQTMMALARLATRGLDPGGHRPTRGAKIAREIGEQLVAAGLAPADAGWAQDLERAMTLRELGRCLLPADLWMKPGKLSEGEFELVRSLPDRAAALFDELMPANETPVRWHELTRSILAGQGERWDGGGYPAGRKGESIPIEARIAAVVGAYDAMTRPRPYGVPRPHAAALSQLTEESGAHFDPAVVRALAARGTEVDRIRAAHTLAPEGDHELGDHRAA